MFACVSVFDRPCSAWPARLISLGIKMFTLHGTRFRITGLCLCASYVLAKIIKGVNNICLLPIIADWCLNKEIGFLTCTKRNRVWEAKSQNLIRRTLLFSLLCCYNSLLILISTTPVLLSARRPAALSAKLVLKQVFSDWLKQTDKHETGKKRFSVCMCAVKLTSSGQYKTRRAIKILTVTVRKILKLHLLRISCQAVDL